MNRTKNKIAISVLISLSSSFAFAQSSTQVNEWGETKSTVNIQSKNAILSSGMSSWDDELSAAESARFDLIRSTAAALGAQAGNAARTREIQAALLSKASQYDRAFDFSKVMLEPGFLPPVISEGRDAYNQPSDDEARAADRIFKIERPARLVSASPSWRSYLLVSTPSPTRPDDSVLPKSSAEKKEWDRWASDGWDQGVQMADQNFEANLARLNQDFQGMIKFKLLFEQGLVTKPVLARSSLGTTGGGDEMAINDRIIRVTAKASLDPNTKNWSSPKPATSASDDLK